MFAAVFVLVGTGAALTGWFATQQWEAQMLAAAQRNPPRAAVVRDARLQQQAPAAGISLQRPAVRPLNVQALGKEAGSPGFQAFHHRCTSCHRTPDPSMHGPAGWDSVVTRMAGWMQSAGVMPMQAEERREIVRFLQRTSDADRASRREDGQADGG